VFSLARERRVVPEARREEIDMTGSISIGQAKELDARSGNGIDVELLWYPTTDTVTVSVRDASRDLSFELAVDPARALEAFHHPFAFASSRGIPFAAPMRAHEPQPEPAWDPR
jgi:hypothetical protein